MSSDIILCRVTPWYHKRRIAMLVLMVGFAAYFFYDWKIGYPLKQEAAKAKAELKAQGKESEYASLAQKNGWPAEPDLSKDWNWAIREQLVCALLASAGAAIILFFYLRTLRRTLTADDIGFTPPGGPSIPFSSAFRIDRRKWDHKGLAYVYYRDGKGGQGRAVIDDLIFGGAVKVLDRLQANFKGEVIELEKETPAGETTPEKPSEAGDGEAPPDGPSGPE